MSESDVAHILSAPYSYSLLKLRAVFIINKLYVTNVQYINHTGITIIIQMCAH